MIFRIVTRINGAPLIFSFDIPIVDGISLEHGTGSTEAKASQFKCEIAEA